MKLVEIAAAGVDFQMQLPERRHDHLRDASERAAAGLLVAVLVAADEEAGDHEEVAVIPGDEEGGEGAPADGAKRKPGAGAGTRTRKKKTT